MIIDEIGRKREAMAASTVKERGVQVLGSAHGDFESLFRNMELRDLVGGIMSVTIGDAEAQRINAGNKVGILFACLC
jgi:stage III sporulation protein SpoIIIAA